MINNRSLMGRNQHFSILLLTGISVWLFYALAGCGSEPSAGGLSSSTLQQSDSSAPPAWATCTITLWNIQGDGQDSFDYAQQGLAQIRKQTSWPELHILRTEQVTKVCRGYFEDFSTAKAKRTLQQVRSYVDSRGQRPFQQAMFADLPARQKQQITVGPPQWDLRQAPGNASLCIDVFTDRKDRAKDAVKRVKKLRAQAVEAWYYHGQYSSGVYVGHFNAAYEIVTTGKTAGGYPIERRKFVTHDPQFVALRKKFPVYKRNGRAIRLGQTKLYEVPRLVPIPRFGQDVLDTEVGL